MISLNKLKNIISGTILHWVNANNDYVKYLTERANCFPPKIETLLVQFSLSSYLLSEELLGPDKGGNKIIKKDPKLVTAAQFKSLHNLQIWFFLALFSLQHPDYRKNILKAGKEFIDINEVEKEMVFLVLGFKSMDNFDVGQSAFTLYKKICLILKYNSVDSLSESLSYTHMVVELYYKAMRSCKIEWRTPLNNM